MLRILRSQLRVTTIKITLSGCLLGVFLVLSYVSEVVKLSIFPTAPFLKLEFAAFIALFSVEAVGIIGATVVCVLTLLIRLSFDPNLVGIFALLLAYLALTGTYFFVKYFLYNYGVIKNTRKLKSKKVGSIQQKEILSNVIAAISAVSMTAVLMVICNYAFIFRLYLLFYGLPSSSFKSIYVPLLGIVFAFNLINFGVNAGIFLIIVPSLHYLRHHTDGSYKRLVLGK